MDETLRKAAVLIDSLDAVTARLLLERMPNSEAGKILEARRHLQNVSEAERRQVLREFNDENYHAPSGAADKFAGEASPALNLLPAESPDELAPVQVSDATSTTKPFEFLNNADATALARHLVKEDSHRVAIVLCHLPPRQAAEILKQLPDSKRIDIVIRMSSIDELTPEIVGDIESEFRELLCEQESSTGFGAILSIMESVDTWSRGEMIDQLKPHHRELAERIANSIDRQNDFAPAASNATDSREPVTDPPEADDQTTKQLGEVAETCEFDDLVQLDGHSLATLIQESNPDEVLLALTGATPWMVDHLLGQLPPREEKRLRRKMDRCGPLALKDIDVAQEKLVQLTGRLAAEGKINPPTRRPFTSVA